MSNPSAKTSKPQREYDVDCYPINPPVGGDYKYGARAVVITSTHGRQRIMQEWWGKTAEEARNKARKSLDEWLEKKE